MLFITKLKSCTEPKKTVYTILYNAVRKILQNMDSLKNGEFDNQYYDMMVSTNNLLKGLLDVNTICTHNLINLVNRLWTIVNRLGTEIRMSQGSESNHMKNNLLYTNLQNEYFTVFLELNTLISREIEELQKSKYDERDICTAIAAAAVGDHIKHVHFCRGDCSAAAGGGGGADDDDRDSVFSINEVFFDVPAEPVEIPELEIVAPAPSHIKSPTSSPSGSSRKKIVPYTQTPRPVEKDDESPRLWPRLSIESSRQASIVSPPTSQPHTPKRLSTVYEQTPVAGGNKKSSSCFIM